MAGIECHDSGDIGVSFEAFPANPVATGLGVQQVVVGLEQRLGQRLPSIAVRVRDHNDVVAGVDMSPGDAERLIEVLGSVVAAGQTASGCDP